MANRKTENTKIAVKKMTRTKTANTKMAVQKIAVKNIAVKKIVVYRNGIFVHEDAGEFPVSIFMNCSPKIAKLFLERNTRNRAIIKGKVMALKNDIYSNNWHITGDAIAFFEDGTLAEGQHRLQAIVETGKTLPIHVVFGLLPEAAGAMGCGKVRNEKAISKIMFARDISKGSLEMTGFYMQMANIRNKVSQFQKMDFYNNLLDHVNFVLETFEKHSNGKKIMSGVAVSYIYAALMSARSAGVSDKNLDDFIRVLVTGITRSEREGIVIRQLRDKIANNKKISIGGEMRIEFFLRTQKVLKNFINGTTSYKSCSQTNKMIYSVPEEILPKIW